MTLHWYFIQNGEKYGPYSMDQLQQFAALGRLLPTDMLLQDGSDKEVMASSVPGLVRENTLRKDTLPPSQHTESPPYPPVRQDVLDVLPVNTRQSRPLPDPRPSNSPFEPTDLLVPTNVSGWAIASCYMGFIGFCLPLLGLVFAVPAFICGIIALRKWKKRSSYGSVTTNIRTIIGLVLSSLAIVIWGGALVFVLVSSK